MYASPLPLFPLCVALLGLGGAQNGSLRRLRKGGEERRGEGGGVYFQNPEMNEGIANL